MKPNEKLRLVFDYENASDGSVLALERNLDYFSISNQPDVFGIIAIFISFLGSLWGFSVVSPSSCFCAFVIINRKTRCYCDAHFGSHLWYRVYGVVGMFVESSGFHRRSEILPTERYFSFSEDFSS